MNPQEMFQSRYEEQLAMGWSIQDRIKLDERPIKK
jgi:hypothetical protein